MDDQKAEEVRRSVEDFLGSPDTQGLDIGKAEHFERMVGYVRQHVQGDDQSNENELRVITAMCWLGPSRSGIPPGNSAKSCCI
jgi:hypothetical protein